MPSKWAVRNSMPEEVLALGGAGGRLEVQRRHPGERLVHGLQARPRPRRCGGRCPRWPSPAGGPGRDDSHSRSERIWGSRASSWLSAVVPVRGRPMMNERARRPRSSSMVGVPAVDVLDAQPVGQQHAAGACPRISSPSAVRSASASERPRPAGRVPRGSCRRRSPPGRSR